MKACPVIKSQHIFYWREYLGLTQKAVAQRLGITQAALSQMEAGGKRLRKVTLEKLAAAVGIGIE